MEIAITTGLFWSAAGLIIALMFGTRAERPLLWLILCGPVLWIMYASFVLGERRRRR